MAFPTTSVLDDFNRANGAIGSAWTANPFNDGATAFDIISNQIRSAGATFGYDGVYWNAGTFGPDMEVGATAAVLSAEQEFYAILRLVQPSPSADTADAYVALFINYGGFVGLGLYRTDNTVLTLLGATQTLTALSAGDGFGAEMNGSTFQAHRRVSGTWAAYGSSRTDSTYTAAGYACLLQYDNSGGRTTRIDDIFGGTVVTASVEHGWPASEDLGFPHKQRAPMPMIVGPREDRIMSMQGRQKG